MKEAIGIVIWLIGTAIFIDNMFNGAGSIVAIINAIKGKK